MLNNKKRPFDKKIGKNIKTIRSEQDITQKQLADAINMTPQAISKIERGVYPPTVEKLYEICEYLNADPNQIIYNDSGWTQWREENTLKTFNSLRGLGDMIEIAENFWARAYMARKTMDENSEIYELEMIIQICLSGKEIDDYRNKFLPSISENDNRLEAFRAYAESAYKKWLNTYLDKVIKEIRDNKINNLEIKKRKGE